MKNYNVSEIKTLVGSAKTVLIAVPQIGIDSIASALALALNLKKVGKEVKVFCPQKTDQNYQKLSGLELLTDTYISNDLVVSLNYPLDQIDQVSYNDNGGRLNLVVKTKSEAPKIENNQIIINNEYTAFDACFMLGDEASLGINNVMVNKGNWIYISPTDNQKPWAKISLIDPDAPFSEIFTFLLPMIGLNLDMDSGKNLLIGLRVATQSFSVNVSPETFEAGAVCLRATQPSENNQPINQMPIENVEKSASLISNGNPTTNSSNQLI